jgi:putative two-component system response regulator
MLTAQGIIQSDLHNLPAAFESFSEALDLCELLQDPHQLWVVWHNVGAALSFAELPAFASAAARLAVEYAQRIECSQVAQKSLGMSLANIACACLHTGEYALGLRSARQAVSILASHIEAEAGGTREVDIANYALALCHQTRLFLRVGSTNAAGTALAKAQQFVGAAATNTRAVWSVQLASAMFLVHSGRFDEGVHSMRRLLRSAVDFSPELAADSLRDLVESHRLALRHREAEKHMCDLAEHMKRVRSDDLLFHHERHLQRLAETSVGLISRRVCHFATPYPDRWRSNRNRPDRGGALDDLSAAAELHDDPSGKHSFRVGELSRALATRLGLSPEESSRIGGAARLHDIGKVSIPSQILRKRGPLESGEIRVMRAHVEVGAELLAAACFDHTNLAVSVARHHHEWWQGCGYPDGLAAEEIPFAARIVAIAESFDAMTHDRPYRPRLSVSRALQVISERSGVQFDPHMTESFCALVRDLQQLNNNIDELLERGARRSGFFRASQRLGLKVAHDRL